MGKLCPVKKMEALITNSVYLCPQVYLCLPNPKSMVFSDEKVRKGGEMKLTRYDGMQGDSNATPSGLRPPHTHTQVHRYRLPKRFDAS